MQMYDIHIVSPNSYKSAIYSALFKPQWSNTHTLKIV